MTLLLFPIWLIYRMACKKTSSGAIDWDANPYKPLQILFMLTGYADEYILRHKERWVYLDKNPKWKRYHVRCDFCNCFHGVSQSPALHIEEKLEVYNHEILNESDKAFRIIMSNLFNDCEVIR